LFRFESATFSTYWVLVVMNQFTRRIIGFGVHGGIVDGSGLCRMLQRAIRGHQLPKYLSSDHDPLYRFHQWQANLRILEVAEIKTIPYAPLSHPFVERLIGTLRREFLDRTLFWTTADLEAKLVAFQHYRNGHQPMPDWREDCQIRPLNGQDHPHWPPMGGRNTVGVCSRLRLRHGV
jgi:putative transposase